MPLLLRGDPFDRAQSVNAEMKRRASFAPVLNGVGREMASFDALVETAVGVVLIWVTNPWMAAWRACWLAMRVWRMLSSIVDLDVVGQVRTGNMLRGSWGAIGFNSAFTGGRGWEGGEAGVGGTRVGAAEYSDQCGVVGGT